MRYNNSLESWSIVSVKKSFFNMPVGLVKALKPLGHSGQRRLQEVVGSKENEQYTVGVTKATFIEPGVGHEFPLGRTTSLFARVGLTATVATNYYSDEYAGLLSRGFFSASARAYYNAEKRADQDKNVDHNSANYFALLALVATSPLNKWSNYDPQLN